MNLLLSFLFIFLYYASMFKDFWLTRVEVFVLFSQSEVWASFSGQSPDDLSPACRNTRSDRVRRLFTALSMCAFVIHSLLPSSHSQSTTTSAATLLVLSSTGGHTQLLEWGDRHHDHSAFKATCNTRRPSRHTLPLIAVNCRYLQSPGQLSCPYIAAKTTSELKHKTCEFCDKVSFRLYNLLRIDNW